MSQLVLKTISNIPGLAEVMILKWVLLSCAYICRISSHDTLLGFGGERRTNPKQRVANRGVNSEDDCDACAISGGHYCDTTAFQTYNFPLWGNTLAWCGCVFVCVVYFVTRWEMYARSPFIFKTCVVVRLWASAIKSARNVQIRSYCADKRQIQNSIELFVY